MSLAVFVRVHQRELSVGYRRSSGHPAATTCLAHVFLCGTLLVPILIYLMCTRHIQL